MKIVYRTDIGNSRIENQDNYRAGWQSKKLIWAVMCDGMGGANGGALASRIATDTVEKLFTENFDPNFNADQIEAFMIDVLDKVNSEIYQCSRQNISMSGMGTTAVLAVIKNHELFLAHIGDSRAYLYSGGMVSQLTRDHSMVQELVENGSITEEEAYTHPRKNLITRALGVSPTITAEFNSFKVKEDDIVFLCTDGLSNYITCEGFVNILKNTLFFDTANTMVNEALEAGGSDNISVMLIQVKTAEDE